MGVIAGLASVGFVIFLTILVIYCCCRIRRKRSVPGGELPDASPYRQTCHPASPSTAAQNNHPHNQNPYFMEGSRHQGQTNFLNNAGVMPGSNFSNPHQSTALYPTTSVGVPPHAANTVPYPVNHPQGMPMPMQMPMPQNYAPVPVANFQPFQPSAPLPNAPANDQPPPYHTVVAQNPYQPYKFQ